VTVAKMARQEIHNLGGKMSRKKTILKTEGETGKWAVRTKLMEITKDRVKFRILVLAMLNFPELLP